MIFHELNVKGITRYLHDAELGEKDLRLHISQVDPGGRSHPPHQHGGFEAFYILEGQGTVEIDGDEFVIHANEAAVFNPRKMHGLRNDGETILRYIVLRAGDDGMQ
ncbi:MAG: cupin domain-containing protein [Caldilineaceae bacterium]|nr:cupin domain-containing protein [Caldilineaceae bacterium]